MIAIDIETYDPDLKTMGPGVYRKDGYILGFSFCDEQGHAEYINIGHKGLTGEERNVNIERVRIICATREAKIGANIMYDIDWLENWGGIRVNGDIHDIQIAEPLINEHQPSYSLNAQAERYLNETKQTDEIEAYCKHHEWEGSTANHFWKMPHSLLEKYAIQDARLPLAIFAKQKLILEEQGLWDLYRLECRLIPLLLQMRKVGVRIDENKKQKAAERIYKSIADLSEELYTAYGGFNFNSTRDLAELFDKLGIAYGKTAKGNPSIKNDFLETVEHPVAKKIAFVRKSDKVLHSFIAGAFTEYCIKGRIHCQFYPLKRDEGGTVSGRFSSQNPNLQQVPRPDEEEGHEILGNICRSLFIPEEGCLWGKIDYNQIEYRIIAHFARGPMSEEIRERYRNNPKTDYHRVIMDWTGLNRPDAKRMNFGVAYFMGVTTMTQKFNWTYAKAEELKKRYYENVPFMVPTRNAVVDVGKGRGYIRTLLHRRARVDEEMKEAHKEYVLFNRLIQGCAADIMKKAMVDAYEAGVFEVLFPHLTVHDEMDVSIPETKEGFEAFKEMKVIMETAIALKVPIIADAEVGPSWGEVEHYDFETHQKELS
jgi:DNA polymerase I-like protein with 3'-5' exonuclease and polymerase domains